MAGEPANANVGAGVVLEDLRPIAPLAGAPKSLLILHLHILGSTEFNFRFL